MELADRRRVLVAVAEGAQAIAALYGAVDRETRKALERRSAAELAVITDFLRDMTEITVEQVAFMAADRQAGHLRAEGRDGNG